MARKTLEEQKAELEQKKAQLEARLKVIEAKSIAQQRKSDTRRKIIVGALALGAAEARGVNREWLLQILKNAQPRRQDKPIVDGLIKELEALAKRGDQESSP